MSKSKAKVTLPAPVIAAAPSKKRTLAHDQHWRDWQKRHRAPRAADLLYKIRKEEATKQRAERASGRILTPTSREESALDFDAEDIETST